MPESLDRYDRQIITILQQDGRISNQQLADQVGLSTAACWRRVKSLSERGVLKKHTTLIDPEAMGYDLCVIIMVSLVRHQQDHASEFQAAVQAYPEVMQCYAVTGDADYMLRVIIQNMAAYDRFLNEKIFSLPGVSQVRSNFALREVKYETAIPVNPT
ncbi:Lrp/AsnC family transcriptional regulator [Neptuniibacter halophilus]|uniref:Lrp/AsnC family transcriptional regulator n=1 Tax=Neptuniibacter halophilus TaxID=651666 RepID=UPI0025746CA9|nr:Lrp/AsnC family transcriptional regulator [Neptuniibacter halophilus]